MKAHDYMRMRELVERSGVPRTTIHFYLRQGLLHPPTKTGRTIAYYDESHLIRLKKIQELRKGMRVPVAFLRERINELQTAEGDAVEERASSPVSDKNNARDPRARRRQEIVEAAIRVFSKKGYHQAKIEDITRAIGISKGTFYIYFTNKRELFIEVIDDVFRTIVGQAGKAIKGEEDPFRRTRIRMRVFADSYLKYAELLHLLRAELASEETWAKEKIKKSYHGLTEPVIRDVRQDIERGTVSRNIDPDLAVYAFIGMMEMLCFRVTLDPKYSVEQITDFMMDLYKRLRFGDPDQPSRERPEHP